MVTALTQALVFRFLAIFRNGECLHYMLKKVKHRLFASICCCSALYHVRIVRYGAGFLIILTHPFVAAGPKELLESTESLETRAYLAARLAKGELIFGYVLENWVAKAVFITCKFWQRETITWPSNSWNRFTLHW